MIIISEISGVCTFLFVDDGLEKPGGTRPGWEPCIKRTGVPVRNCFVSVV